MKNKKYYKYELKMAVMNLLSIVLFFLPIFIILLCGYRIEISVAGSPFWFLGMLLYLVIHELFHGLGYSMFAKNKKNIKFGIEIEKGVLYAACQEKLSKKEILISLLLPLVFLTIIPLPVSLIFHIDWLLLYSVVNFGGAIGDMLMTILIATAPRDVEYIDYNNDIGAYLISGYDMSEHKTLGFKLTEVGDEKSKKPDKSIKKITISIPSWILIALSLIFVIVSLVLK